MPPSNPEREKRLRDVVFFAEVDAGSGFRRHHGKRRHGRLLRLSNRRSSFELVLHFVRRKVAVNGEHDVLREVVAPVKLLEILAVNAIEVRILDLPSIRCVAAVKNSAQLAIGDALRIVIAARDPAARLRDEQIDFILAEFGLS